MCRGCVWHLDKSKVGCMNVQGQAEKIEAGFHGKYMFSVNCFAEFASE